MKFVRLIQLALLLAVVPVAAKNQNCADCAQAGRHSKSENPVSLNMGLVPAYNEAGKLTGEQNLENWGSREFAGTSIVDLVGEPPTFQFPWWTPEEGFSNTSDAPWNLVLGSDLGSSVYQIATNPTPYGWFGI